MDTALRVMHQESSGRADNHNWNPGTGDDSWGLYQINRYGTLAAGRPAPEWLTVAENNIKYAAEMHSRSGWTPWANTCKKVGCN